MVALTSAGFLIFDSRHGGYGIAQPSAGVKSLPGLPVLAAAASADVVIFLKTLSRSSGEPLLELRGNPRSSRPDGDGVSASYSFLKALSCLLAVSPVLARMMSSLVGLAMMFSCVWAEHPLSPCSGQHVHACMRLCHVLYPSVLILLLL